MLKDIKSGHITGLIFSKLARLARNNRELLDFADTFREQNADLIALQEAIDTSTPAVRLGADRDRGCHSFCDLLPFPLGHGGNHGIEQPTALRPLVRS
jgi:hypothetical protein